MPLQTGQVLNQRYRIVKPLGQGGFGAVYRSWDMTLSKPCAVKENLETSAEAQRQFTREASILASLKHTNLPRVSDHFIIEGQGQYLVMDYVEGEDLAHVLIRQGSLPIEQVLPWINQAADALTYLHTRSNPIVHRDIKPANIRITPDEKAILVDFGLVKYYDPGKHTTLGARAITPGYAPPEQYGQGITDPRSDMYALGATLYALLTGVEPQESVLRVTGVQLVPAHLVNPEIPTTIGKAIERAMELEPNHRYRTVADFKAALNKPSVDSQQTIISQRPQTEIASLPPIHPTLQTPPSQVQPQARPQAQPQARSQAQPQAQPQAQAQVWQQAQSHPAPRQTPRPPSPYYAAAKPKRKDKRALAIILSLLAVIIIIIMGAWYLMETGYFDSETPANLQATVAAGAQATATSQAEATATVQAQLLQETGWQLVFGPLDGKLDHNPDDGLIKASQASLDLQDFVAEANFINPYATSIGSWDYGFIFRHTSPNQHYRLLIQSDKKWLLRNNSGEPDGPVIDQGDIPNLNTSDSGSNDIRLVCEGSQGKLYINDTLIAELDLSVRMNSGDVILTTGVLAGNQIRGYTTKYHGFTVWALP